MKLLPISPEDISMNLGADHPDFEDTLQDEGIASWEDADLKKQTAYPVASYVFDRDDAGSREPVSEFLERVPDAQRTRTGQCNGLAAAIYISEAVGRSRVADGERPVALRKKRAK